MGARICDNKTPRSYRCDAITTCEYHLEGFKILAKINTVSVVCSFPFALTDDAQCKAPCSLFLFHSVNATKPCSRQPRVGSAPSNEPMRGEHETSITKSEGGGTVKFSRHLLFRAFPSIETSTEDWMLPRKRGVYLLRSMPATSYE